MATWQEVQTFIHANYKAIVVNADLLRLEFDLGNGRSQNIFVGHAGEGTDMDCLRFSSPFATEDAITPAQFAQVCEGAIFGATKIGNLYAFVHIALLEGLDANEITVPMAWVTHQADEAERNLGLGDRI